MFEQFQQMPKGMQIMMAVCGGASLLSVAALIDPRAAVIVIIGLLLIAAAVFSWKFYQGWRAKQRAKQLSGSIAANSSAAPSNVSDPGRRAKLDSLQRNFDEGLSKFRAAGKDMYSLPWYVVCGEPGSGKTEAVRHCGAGFPPGLQNEMQGAGGTLNMHWWFTNTAVLLDTAGKLLFEEAPPGSTTEWTEFLSLLRKTRPNCPINGLLLVIPSESLIKDTSADIERKAGKIARQLDQIQRALDVRFPVFVLVTKCDLINGFREFFGGMKDPSLQQQLLGWSNPESLDTPFKPDAVEAHLQLVSKRLERRRLGLLRDPVATDSGKRRADEVDALFSLPASVQALSPRLRKYLEMIFVAGEWSAKPLFLRGIYFTSALTEGSALDQELASALGLPAENLPEGKAWERERSFFLRDLFVKKVFVEKGLVTRATNTRAVVRRRQWILGSVLGIGLISILAFSWFGARSLQESVGREAGWWAAGAAETSWTEQGFWRPVVAREGRNFSFTGGEAVDLKGESPSLVEFHDSLRERVLKDVPVPWVFKPLEHTVVGANKKRRQAQRVLFESSVINPLVDASRARLSAEGAPWSPANAGMLASLIDLEAMIHLKTSDGFAAEPVADEFFPAMLAPWLAKDQPLPTELSKVFDMVYTGAGDGRGRWPSPALSAGKTFRENKPISTGWESLTKSIAASQENQKRGFTLLRDGRLVVARFIAAEQEFQRAALSPRTGDWKGELIRRHADLTARGKAVDELVAAGATLTAETPFTLDGGYKAAVEAARKDASRAAVAINAIVLKHRAATESAEKSSGPTSEFTLLRDVRRRIGELDRQVSTMLEEAMPASEQVQFQELDVQALKPLADGKTAAYSARLSFYQAGINLLTAPVETDVLGRLPGLLDSSAKAVSGLRSQFAAYEAWGRTEFSAASNALLDVTAEATPAALIASYRTLLKTSLDSGFGYPLSSSGAPVTLAQVAVARATFAKLKADAAGLASNPSLIEALNPSFARAARAEAFAAALVGADGVPQQAKLVMVKEADQKPILEKLLTGRPQPFRLVGRPFPSFRVGGKDFRARGVEANQELIKVSVADSVPDLEFSRTPDPKAQPDARHNFGGEWGLLRQLELGSIRREEGREWDIVLRVRDGAEEVYLVATVVFERPLPPLDQWR